MFEALLANIVGPSSIANGRSEGAAFLKAAKDLYQLAGIAYLGVNIPAAPHSAHYTHCAYSDRGVTHRTSGDAVEIERLNELCLIDGPVEWEPSALAGRLGFGNGSSYEGLRGLTFPLPSRRGEHAVFGFTAAASSWHEKTAHMMREVRILGDYLHGHVLRMNGHDADNQILVSARELDCLKWTAAGKTAWEASVILGISERTVRFHLNTAREKLDCTTTTQAVAKAITQRLIHM
jgi:DNA-binding CsgD family transcriptional regulator